MLFGWRMGSKTEGKTVSASIFWVQVSLFQETSLFVVERFTVGSFSDIRASFKKDMFDDEHSLI